MLGERASPQIIYLGITDVCNMACPMCITQDHVLHQIRSHLSSDDIRSKILEPGREMGVSEFVISGGEPTLAPHLMQVVGDGAKLGYKIHLATNLLHFSARAFDEFFGFSKHQQNNVQVSFDSFIAREMDVIRGKRVFDDVVENCKSLVRLRNETNATSTITAAVVLQQENVDSALGTIDYLLNSLGFDQVVVQQKHSYPTISAATVNDLVIPPLSSSVRRRLINVSREIFRMGHEDRRIIPTNGTLDDWIQFLDNPRLMKKKCRSSQFIFIDCYGNLRGCLFGEILGSIHEVGLTHYRGRRNFRDFVDFADGCGLCTHGCS